METVVLSIDAERERISLGIKQLIEDPFSNYTAIHDKGAIVMGIVKDVDQKGVTVTLDQDVDGYIKAADLARDRVEDPRSVISVGAELESKIVLVDRKNRAISLSVRAKDVSEEKAAVKAHKKQDAESSETPTTIGDLIRAQMDK